MYSATAAPAQGGLYCFNYTGTIKAVQLKLCIDKPAVFVLRTDTYDIQECRKEDLGAKFRLLGESLKSHLSKSETFARVTKQKYLCLLKKRTEVTAVLEEGHVQATKINLINY